MEWWKILIIVFLIGWVLRELEKKLKRIDDLEDRVSELEDKLEPESNTNSDVDYPITEGNMK